MTVAAETPVIFARLVARYPRTVAVFGAMPEGATALAAVERLDTRFAAAVRGQAGTGVLVPCETLPSADAAYEVIYIGGVLGLINATALLASAARAGQSLRVALIDEAKAGFAHREWNISRAELAELVAAGVVTWDDLEGIVATRYAAGIIRFHATGTGVPAIPVDTTDVLDVAVRADALLAHCRARFLALGGTLIEGRRFRRVHQRRCGRVGSVVEVEGPNGATQQYAARLVVDAMGTISPLAWAINADGAIQGVCPTVGTVARGFQEGTGPRTVDRTTGEVLITVADAQDGHQLIWEGFPAGGDAYTVYVFYYDRVRENAPQSLLDLFEQYFMLLPTYKEPGPDFAHLKPVYGFIPARYHDTRPGTGASRGVVSIGDAAAQQSPLTFCGFGSHTRNLRRITDTLRFCLTHDLLEARHLRHAGAHQANLAPLWGLSRMMAHGGGDVAAVNRVMNVFLGSLHTLGTGTTRRFLRDNPTWGEYTRMMLFTVARYPWVFTALHHRLGTRGFLAWYADYARFGLTTLGRAALGDPLHGPRARLIGAAGQCWPALGLALTARQWEHRVMRESAHDALEQRDVEAVG